ncbi:hypothetical protein QBC44DRAFT_21453 [Cladorrhinum sp. PSN332]|nr:hypothetical protein QBC44DRAFT_21453 [Cladorrhinum sp. PSN332]
MAETLKRTFHGCLTCRKRKVRCLGGGNPCQNCTRMNITCHSSFETNLRIRVSTPNGQKAVDSKPAEPIRRAQQRPSPPAPAAPVPDVITTNGSDNDMYAANYHYSQFTTLPQQSPGFITASFPMHHTYTDVSSQGLTALAHTPDLGHLQHYPVTTTAAAAAAAAATTWNTFNDFAYLDPALDPHHHHHQHLFNTNTHTLDMHHQTPSPQAPTIPSMPQMAFNAWMPDTTATTTSPSSVPSNFIAENVVVPQQQEGPKEWVPKRRRRNKRTTSPKETTPTEEAATATNGGGEEAMMTMMGSDGFHQGHDHMQGEYAVGMGDGWYGTVPGDYGR